MYTTYTLFPPRVDARSSITSLSPVKRVPSTRPNASTCLTKTILISERNEFTFMKYTDRNIIMLFINPDPVVKVGKMLKGDLCLHQTFTSVPEFIFQSLYLIKLSQKTHEV